MGLKHEINQVTFVQGFVAFVDAILSEAQVAHGYALVRREGVAAD